MVAIVLDQEDQIWSSRRFTNCDAAVASIYSFQSNGTNGIEYDGIE